MRSKLRIVSITASLLNLLVPIKSWPQSQARGLISSNQVARDIFSCGNIADIACSIGCWARKFPCPDGIRVAPSSCQCSGRVPACVARIKCPTYHESCPPISSRPTSSITSDAGSTESTTKLLQSSVSGPASEDEEDYTLHNISTKGSSKSESRPKLSNVESSTSSTDEDINSIGQSDDGTLSVQTTNPQVTAPSDSATASESSVSEGPLIEIPPKDQESAKPKSPEKKSLNVSASCNPEPCNDGSSGDISTSSGTSPETLGPAATLSSTPGCGGLRGSKTSSKTVRETGLDSQNLTARLRKRFQEDADILYKFRPRSFGSSPYSLPQITPGPVSFASAPLPQIDSSKNIRSDSILEFSSDKENLSQNLEVQAFTTPAPTVTEKGLGVRGHWWPPGSPSPIRFCGTASDIVVELYFDLLGNSEDPTPTFSYI